MRYFSLFTGIGGFELGIQKAYVDTTSRDKERGSQTNQERNKGQGLQSAERESPKFTLGHDGIHYWDIAHKGQPTCVGYSEIDKYAIQIYQKHFPEHKNYGDITKINEEELPDFDLLVGGFPCQSFSIAGRRQGFEDTRGTLFFDIARIVRKKQPRLLLLENVKGILSHDQGRTFGIIIATLDELGYDVQWQVLNSKNHGVPQNRERVLIVGHLRGTPRPEVFPFGESYCEPKNSRGEERKNVANTLRAKLGGPDLENSYFITQRPRGKNEGGSKEIAPTLTGRSYQDNNHVGGIRKLTPMECERLQGFPDCWTDGISNTQRYKCLGNAVTVNVIADVMECII